MVNIPAYTAFLKELLCYPKRELVIKDIISIMGNVQVIHHPFLWPIVPFTIPWNRWQANKHLVYTICTAVAPLFRRTTARSAAKAAGKILAQAVKLHGAIQSAHVSLRDETASYQEPWASAVAEILKHARDDYDYLELLP